MAVSFFYTKICLLITGNWASFLECECYLGAIEFIIQALYLFYSKANLKFQEMKTTCVTWALPSSKFLCLEHFFCLRIILLLDKILPHLKSDVYLVVTFRICFWIAHFRIFFFSFTEAYLGPNWTSTMEHFSENRSQKKIPCRRSTGFWIHR